MTTDDHWKRQNNDTSVELLERNISPHIRWFLWDRRYFIKFSHIFSIYIYANQLCFIEPFHKQPKPLIFTTKLNFSEHFSWGAEYHIISPVFQTVDTSIMFGHEMLLATFYTKWMVCGLGDSLLCWTDESLSCHAICISLKVPLPRSDYMCCQLPP